MADDLKELTEDEYDTLDSVLDQVWRVLNRDLTTDDQAVPSSTFAAAAEKKGYNAQQVRYRLQARVDFHKIRFNAGDRQTPVHCWYRGSANDPPEEYVPRPAKKVRMGEDRRVREIYPDKRYRLNARQWWGFQLIKAAENGEL